MRLYDILVTVDRIEGGSVCGLEVGNYFEETGSSRVRIPSLTIAAAAERVRLGACSAQPHDPDPVEPDLRRDGQRPDLFAEE